MTDASSSQPQPEPAEGVESALVRRYQAQTEAAEAQTTFWRRVAGVAIGALVGVGAALVALAVVLVLIASSTHREGVASRQKADQVLTIARQATDPKRNAQAINGFLQSEAAIFRLDCDAKAHQLTILDNDLGGHVAEATLEAECGRIAAPPATP